MNECMYMCYSGLFLTERIQSLNKLLFPAPLEKLSLKQKRTLRRVEMEGTTGSSFGGFGHS